MQGHHNGKGAILGRMHRIRSTASGRQDELCIGVPLGEPLTLLTGCAVPARW